ncbi:MAG TPA: hypothetical protein PKC87_00930 [Candidatus Absconditabacterales bacterium]|nr:hypothetical protein [Candidatus Absconditabacterales bacterium]
MKKNKSEAQLRKLCTPKGVITKFQNNINTVLSNHTEESDQVETLLKIIDIATRFQDKELKLLSKIKEGLKIENPELFCKFGRFYATLKVCGRDCHKAEKHHSFVSNKAKLRRFKIGKTIHYSATKTNIFLSSEFNRDLLSLSHIQDLKAKKSMGEFHNLMMEDIKQEINGFISKNGKTLGESLFQ